MELRTLGGLGLAGAGFARVKPLLLLAYLALEGPKERRFLADLLWPRRQPPAQPLGGAVAAAHRPRRRTGRERHAPLDAGGVRRREAARGRRQRGVGARRGALPGAVPRRRRARPRHGGARGVAVPDARAPGPASAGGADRAGRARPAPRRPARGRATGGARRRPP